MKYTYSFIECKSNIFLLIFQRNLFKDKLTHKVYYEKILIKKKRKLRTKTFC